MAHSVHIETLHFYDIVCMPLCQMPFILQLDIRYSVVHYHCYWCG